MKTSKTFTELRCRMVLKNINQRELAQVAGIADATMTDRMAGRSYFRVDEISRIAKCLDIQASEYYQFFFASDNYPSSPRGRKA